MSGNLDKEGGGSPPAKTTRVLRSHSHKNRATKEEIGDTTKKGRTPPTSEGKDIGRKRKKNSSCNGEVLNSKPTKIRKTSTKNEGHKESNGEIIPVEMNVDEKNGISCVAISTGGSDLVEANPKAGGHLNALQDTSTQEHLGDPQNRLDQDDPQNTQPQKTEDNVELLNDLLSLKTNLASVLAKIPSGEETHKEPWGILLSNSPDVQPNVPLVGTSFSVGRNRRCNLVLQDPQIPSLLFKLHYLSGIVVLESPASTNLLTVNNRIYRKGARVLLKHGDQINIGGSHVFTYSVDRVGESGGLTATTNPTSLAATNLAGIVALPSTSTLLNLPAIPKASKKRSSVDTIHKGGLPGKNVGTTGGSNSNNGDLLEDVPSTDNLLAQPPQQEVQDLKKQFALEFISSIMPPTQIAHTFDNLSFELNSGVKEMLLSSMYIHLMRPEFVKYVEQLPQSRKILLTGPPGSELYQEQVVAALARQLNASLLVIDPSTLEYDGAYKSLVSSARGEKETESWEESGSGSKERSKGKRSTDKTTKWGSGGSVGGTPLSRLLRQTLHPKGGGHEYKGKVMITLDETSRKVFHDVFGQDGHTFILDQSPGDISAQQSIEDRYDILRIESLFAAIGESSRPVVLFVKEAETTFLHTYDRYSAFKKQLANLNGPVVVVASSVGLLPDKSSGGSLLKSSHHSGLFDLAFLDHLSHRPPEERNKDAPPKVPKLLLKLFSNRVSLVPPGDPAKLVDWNNLLLRDTENLKYTRNIRNLNKVLHKNNMDTEELTCPELYKEIFPNDNIEKIIAWALSYHLMNNPQLQPEEQEEHHQNESSTELTLPSQQKEEKEELGKQLKSDDPSVQTKFSKLRLSNQAFQHAIDVLKKTEAQDANKNVLRDVECENEFERKLLPEVIPPNELEIKFEDIGALDEVKQTIKELVMLPLQRPELFAKGALTRPCKGILLFGPPGTGKTMLAKAVASQSGANFINISMSTIASKWFGEGEKYVKAVFTLASKISPTVIFIDEVDSILGKRERPGEHEAMRKIKNEFMSNWDGLKTKDKERVLVLAATNRPFDLDDAVLRRLSRRLLVDLPNQENRTKILKVILSKEDLTPNFNYDSLSAMTDGFSGSDLKNLCVAAAYQPIREILAKEKEESERKKAEGVASDRMDVASPGNEIVIRPLSLKDFEKSLKEISASVSEDAFSVAELRKWNEMYGEGGNRRKETLSYYL